MISIGTVASLIGCNLFLAALNSTDLGVTWGSLITNPLGAHPIYVIVYGDGVFILANDYGEICRSTNLGLTWGDQVYGEGAVTQPFGNDGYFKGAVYADKRFVIVGRSNADATTRIIYSDWLEAGCGIVEQGENANGYYIRFSNGTQICWKNDTVSVTVIANKNIGTYGWSYYTVDSAEIWTFPVAFIENPSVIVSAEDGPAVYGSLSTTSVNIGVRSNQSNATLDYSAFAIGRWK